jgi:signal transduction histidine kinase
VAGHGDDVRAEATRLASVLLSDVERIAERGAARMQELLPAYRRVRREELVPVVLGNTRNLLEAVGDLEPDRGHADEHYRVSAETRARQGITSDEMLNAWRIGLEVVREEAHARARELGIGTEALLEFVVASLRWGDVGMRASASAHHEAEIRELGRLASEQAALRRVATLVAEGAAPAAVFEAVAGETLALMGADSARVCRYEPGEIATVLAERNTVGAPVPVGTRLTLEGDSVTARVRRTQRPARRADLEGDDTSAALARERGLRSAAGAPIIVDGRLWGVIVAHWTRSDPVRDEAAARINQFAELVATAIANAQARADAKMLTDEQAALRRVAEVVAREAAQAEVFAAIAAEIVGLLGTDEMRMMRYDDNRAEVVAAAGGARDHVFPVGSRWPLGGENVASRVFDTGRPARIDDYRAVSGQIGESLTASGIRAAVGTPVLVQGRLWGTMLALAFTDEPLPADIESRLEQFTELMATAIANAEARAEVKQLVDEQTALSRVATRVALGGLPRDVFDTVTVELAGVLEADHLVVCRYETGSELTVLAHRGTAAQEVPAGTRIDHQGGSVEALVRQTARSARLESFDRVSGTIAELARAAGVEVTVGAPVVVNGEVWGVASAGWNRGRIPPADTEQRMAKFADLLATAIANADSRDQLTASRARLVTEADEARRRVVRDLHDGAQQRLLQTIVTLKLVQREPGPDGDRSQALIAEALEHAQRGNAELRELAHGILPAILTQGGLRSGISSIVSRLDLPVEVDVPGERFPAEIEASAYFIVAEALTNVVKHAHAERAEVKAIADDASLHIEVSDDGLGGADPRGHGLVGLADRVAALDGRLTVQSPAGGGTILAATFPLSGA